MFTQHPTLLIGPADWDNGRMPRAEFERRMAALWAAFPDATEALIFGSASQHAELAYLTSFTPKLEPGIALIKRDGAARLLFGGGPNMVGAMRPLTFIEDMAPLNALGKAIDGWSPIVVGGAAMTTATRKTLDEATAGRTRDGTSAVRNLMQRKSPSELALIHEACEILHETVSATRAAAASGACAVDAVLAGERTAIDAEAQDIRTLFSLDGGRTLRPFEGLDRRTADPLQLYMAVRRFNYWAEGFLVITSGVNDAADAATRQLDAMLDAIKPGVSTETIATMPEGIFRPHPVTQGAAIAPLGLSLLNDAATTITAGEVHSVRSGVSDGGRGHAIVSAVVAVTDNGNEMLWLDTP